VREGKVDEVEEELLIYLKRNTRYPFGKGPKGYTDALSTPKYAFNLLDSYACILTHTHAKDEDKYKLPASWKRAF